MSATLGLSFERMHLVASRRHVTKIMVIDKSYSMKITTGRFSSKTRLQAACEGACSIIDELESDDCVVVLAFGDEIEDVLGGVTDLSGRNKDIVKRKIKGITPNGSTKLYDTILVAANMIVEITTAARLAGAVTEEDFGTFWLTVLTDGEDNRSSSSLSDVNEALQALSQVPALGINIALIGVSLDTTARRKMERMSAAGGSTTRFVDARNIQEVTRAFTEIRVQLSRERIQVPLASIDVSSGAATSRITADSSSGTRIIQHGPHVRCIGHGRGRVNGVAIGDVGVVRAQDSDGDYIVDFPKQDNWYGTDNDVNVDLVAERVRPGALVAVKRTVTDPLYHWGSYEKYNHGLVVAVDHDGKVAVQLGQHPNASARDNLWHAQLQELHAIDDGSFSGQFRGHWPGKLQLGMAVRVPSHVSEPSTQWGSLERGEVGYVRCFKGDSNAYVCDFPSVDGWIGREHDLEVDPVATLIRPGKKVCVRGGMVPKFGWNGINRSSIGVVMSSRYDGGAVQVAFPENSDWKGTLAELETVNAGEVHESCTCDMCKATVRGPRYKCIDCTNFDLCQPCYDAGKHNKFHKFWRLDKPDSIPVELVARGDRVATPPHPTPSAPSTPPKTSGTFVTPPVSPEIVVDAVPVTFNTGDTVRITGLNDKKHLNGKVGNVVFVQENDRFCIKFPSGSHEIIKGSNLESVFQGQFSLNALVEIRGLSRQNDNGKLALVVGHDPAKGRVRVQPLDEQNRQLSLKPTNLILIDEAS